MARVSRHGLNYALKAFMPGKGEDGIALETAILSVLDHPGVPRFVETFSHNDVNYLVQEFIEGYPLSYYMVQGKRFSEEEVKKILFELLKIVRYLHEPEEKRLPVIHRDLRLSNVFWSNDRAHLIDFGFARYFTGEPGHRSKQSDGSCEGLDCYRPGKETYHLLREEVSPRSDLFGAGVIGVDLFTNWIEDEALFQKPWQEIFPAGESLKIFIERLLIMKGQFPSAEDALMYLG